MSRDVVFFDLETQRTFNEVGGRDRFQDLGISVAVTFSTAKNAYAIYTENTVGALVDQLMRADLVVGYNLLGFDYAVLMAHTAFDLPALIPTLDMMVEIERKLGHRLKLDAIAAATLGAGKSADGLQAVKWWREGKLVEIARYCCMDVKVTRLIHEYGSRHGKLHYIDRFGKKRTVDVAWGDGAGS